MSVKENVSVTPGEKLAYIEEFLSGENTYVDGDTIRSSVEGIVKVDWVNRIIYVKPVKNAVRLGLGTQVIGTIINLSGVFGYVKIFFASKDGKTWNRLKYPQTGVVYPPYRVTDVSKVYSVKDEIYGVIVSTKNRILHLSIRDREYGVVKALCKYCGETMHVTKQDGRFVLKCGICQNTQFRKISPLYGSAIVKKLLYNRYQ